MSLTLSGSGTIGGLVAGGLPDATVTNAELVTMDGAKVTGNIAAAQITSALNASGSAPVYACRAWVNFNGTGTVAIRASGNVSSITDDGTGDYAVNFMTAMPDANYSAVMTDEGGITPLGITSIGGGTPSIYYVNVAIRAEGAPYVYDRTSIKVAVFR